ncbi:unnamed protein product, partial [Scytosiphon promiscuus]
MALFLRSRLPVCHRVRHSVELLWARCTCQVARQHFQVGFGRRDGHASLSQEHHITAKRLATVDGYLAEQELTIIRSHAKSQPVWHTEDGRSERTTGGVVAIVRLRIMGLHHHAKRNAGLVGCSAECMFS